MCEQLFIYDCGHLYRYTVRCSKQCEQHKHHHSATSFSSQTQSHESRCHEAKKLERRATLCPKCEMQEKDREVYVNSTKRASLPTTQAKKDCKRFLEKESCTVTRVSTSTAGLRRANSNPALFPSQSLRRVQGMDNGSLRNEYIRLETRPDNTFQAQGDRDTGNSSRCIKGTCLELSQVSGDEAGLALNAHSCFSNDERASSELARNKSLKAPRYQNINNISFNTEQASMKSPQDNEFEHDYSQSTGDSLRHKESMSPKVQDTGNSTLSKERSSIRSSQHNRFGAHHGQKLRLRDLIMPILELDWYTSTYIMLYSPSSGTRFAELLNHSRSESDKPRSPSTEIVRPEKKVRKRLQKMKRLYHQTDSSNESFVCSRAQEVENGVQ